jgi:hypothetical protein
MKKLVPVCAIALVLSAAVVKADIWDLTDGLIGDTNNELTHGSRQLHDLATVALLIDVDFFRIGIKAATSWEVIVGGTTGGLGTSGALLTLVDGVGAVLGTSIPVSNGLSFSRSLRFVNNTLVDDISRLIRVGSAACGLACTSLTQYEILARETTVSLARFNNFGTQVTVLMTQNVSGVAVNATAHFYDGAGTHVHAEPYVIPANGLHVMPTYSVGGGAANGIGGSITITHDAPYAGINAKAVALEPSTGFSFDTPGVYKPW